MVADHVTVIAREDHHGVLALAGFLERVQHATDMCVNQLNHRPVFGEAFPPFLGAVARRLRLEVDTGFRQSGFFLQVILRPFRQRKFGGIDPIKRAPSVDPKADADRSSCS